MKYADKILTVAITVVAVMTGGCDYPTHSDPEFFAEQQSVWQYLKVYSIYQDRVPAMSGGLTPEDMFDAISDTFQGHWYTGYYKPSYGFGPGGGLLPMPSVIGLSNSTVYFDFYLFDEFAIDAFREGIDYMAGFDNIIIDLYNNVGGYLHVADEIINEFLPPGTPYIELRSRELDVITREGKDAGGVLKTENKNPRLIGKNVVVLVNEWSASASEILVSALKDGMNAHIIGSIDSAGQINDVINGVTDGVISGNTYGKGRGQVRITRYGHIEQISITNSRIGGISERTGDYHGRGIEPDTIPGEYVREIMAIMRALNDGTIDDDDVKSYAEELYDYYLFDRQIYFAVRTLEPSIMDPVAEIISGAGSAAAPMRLAKAKRAVFTLRPITRMTGRPSKIGVYTVVDGDALFR